MLSRDTELYLKGTKLTDDDIEMLDNALVEQPDNIKMRIQLLAFFSSRLRNQQNQELTDATKAHYIKEHAKHSLYVIGHAPLDRVSMRPWAIIDADMAPDEHERARTLWLAHLLSKAEPQILLNCMAFMRQSEPDIASKLAAQIRSLPDSEEYLKDLETIEAEPE